ncbi:pseudouridine synthase [Amycolatopsis jiangsuensis]|uniref:RNA pseudouridylate synthase n=1 Tax=Amycolatopsis jiangsuensis TaxID=1181879 RepID=A0A840INL1_9PSEU|nr:pseudouridine synthase [Amycolatopsis jiangsuensis]MBB4683035.1 23S rRNA pseudouridine2605 synthase [Amycolatopsis jiangsuensis]
MTSEQHPDGVRLQKVLSQAGIASRRAAEDLIEAGRVEVDGAVVTELGRRVHPDEAVIHVDGTRVNLRDDLVYLSFNKPKGVHSTMSDDRGRPCVGDYLRGRWEETPGVVHVGRLDENTEGMLLLTNDGDLGHRLMHPSYRVLKTYFAEVEGLVPRGLGKQLRSGWELPDGIVKVDQFRVKDMHSGRTMVELVIHEGRKHIVRRLLASAGHPVRKLVRTAVGDVQLGSQRPGTIRRLNRGEVGSLYRNVGL